MTREDLCPPTQGEAKYATQNACKMCAPLGASLAYAGIKGCISILHGSQGCATYIRRYLISHFREPMDIASSSFSEEDAVFGGGRNLKLGIENVSNAYGPSVIGVATTCLAETIGEDVPQILREYKESKDEADRAKIPTLLQVSTPSYTGDHWEGYHKTVRAIVEQVSKMMASTDAARQTTKEKAPLLMLPGMLSCEDFRYLKSLTETFALPTVLAPDYSDTLDGGSWSSYQRIPEGGASLESIQHAIEGGEVVALGAVSGEHKESAGRYLQEHRGSSLHTLPLPVGIRATDALLEVLEEISGTQTPQHLTAERARLVDAYVDGHKYLSGKTAIVFADPDLLVGICGLLNEIGIQVVGAATGSKTKSLEHLIHSETNRVNSTSTRILPNADHAAIATLCRELKPDLIIGNSKGYPISRELDIPLVRCGMPIHDRVGAQRLLHLGYSGAQRLFDTIVNTLLEHRQDTSEIGFSYL